MKIRWPNTRLFLPKPISCLFLGIFFLLFQIILFFKMYYQRLGAFGCFDQCFYYLAGYFLLKGRALYSQIFFHHQPLAAFLSYFLQILLRPTNLYQLVLYHRLFVFLFSLVMDLGLIFRFRQKGLAFVLLYETTKFYLFGHFFLPDALAVYPLVYLFGLSWEKTEKESLSQFDWLASGFLAWLVIFLRETFIPPAVLIYALILWGKRLHRSQALSLTLLGLLSLSTLAPIFISASLKDYFSNLVTANLVPISRETQAAGLAGIRSLKIFFYPFYLLFSDQNNHFRLILTGLDLIFLASAGILILKLKKQHGVIFVFLTLGLSAIRWVTPGQIYYEAFHLLPWYSLFLIALVSFLATIVKAKTNLFLRSGLILGLTILLGYAVFSPQSFLWEKVDRQGEFDINYTHPFVYGQVIKTLANPQDKLFVDLWHDAIYWQSGLDSAYPYSLYTPIMTNFEIYRQARITMFQDSPPDFYYADCPNEGHPSLFPQERVNDYAELFFDNRPTCLFIRKTKLEEIRPDQWKEVKRFGFYLSQNYNS